MQNHSGIDHRRGLLSHHRGSGLLNMCQRCGGTTEFSQTERKELGMQSNSPSATTSAPIARDVTRTEARRRVAAFCRHILVAVLATGLVSSQAVSAEAAETRKFIAADSSQKRVAIIAEDGATEWEMKIGPLHDLHYLPTGNVLLQDSWTHVIEVNPRTDEFVWQYEARDAEDYDGRRIEIHAFQRLPNGHTMVVESGRARVLELDADGQRVQWMPLKVESPNAHRDTRLARQLSNGHYLVCHEGDGAVREYEPTGRVVWDFRVPLFGRQPADGHGVEAFGNQCFSAIRLANGNTLVATGNGHSVIEFTPAGQDVWSLHQNDLPGIQLAWVTSLQLLPSGNILITNCHAGPENPQLIEVNRRKQVVWTFQDFQRFGNALTNSQIITVNGSPITR